MGTIPPVRLIRNVPCVVFLFVCVHISTHSAAQSWSLELKGIGTFSSPRITDLNGDGTGDIILGLGREEFKACDTAVIALDGVSGAMLWKISSVDNMYTSAALKDLDYDQVADVVIGGRSSELFAISGKTGKIIWKFDKNTAGMKWYNFYNAQFVADQDKDGLDDILISNGGDVLVAPGDPNRPPGHLLVLSGKTGKLLARAQVPDKRETYMSVSAIYDESIKDYKVIFGTGGETVGGSLYVTTLSEIMRGDISKSRLLDKSKNHGYIAPAVWADVTEDKVPDIIANGVEGKILAFDGKTYKRLWSVKVPNTEAYSSIAPGYFTQDNVPDFFVSFAVGVWPSLEWSHQMMVDGKNGKIMHVDSLGFYQTSTPVVLDINGDGTDEILLSVNVHVYDEANNRTLNNMLVGIDFRNNITDQFTDAIQGSNISTTPWIGDINNDDKLDIVFCHATNPKKPYTFDGTMVHKISTSLPIHKKIQWGAYMGSNYDGVFQSR